MQYNFAMNFFSLSLFLSAAIAGFVAYLAYRRREMPGAREMMWIMAALTWWSFSYGVENLQADFDWHLFWAYASYLGIAFVPYFWFLFSVRYTQIDLPAPVQKLLPWLLIFPIITIFVTWTNFLHGWMWSHIEIISLYGLNLQLVEHGPYFWIHAIAAYGFILAGTVVFIRYALNAPDAYRAQTASVLMAVLFLLGSNGLYIFKLLPFPGLDITPFTFTLAGLFLAWGLLRQGLLEAAPITAETILASLGDALLVTDSQNLALYANPAFRALAGLQENEVYNQPTTSILPDWPDIFIPSRGVITEALQFTLSGKIFNLEVQRSPILENQTLRGQIYTFRPLEERPAAPLAAAALPSRRNLPISLLLSAADGKILDLNSEFTYHTGYTREESLGKTALQLGLLDAETRASLLRVLYEKPNISDYTLYVHRKDGGSAAWQVSINVSALSGESFHLWQARPLLGSQ